MKTTLKASMIGAALSLFALGAYEAIRHVQNSPEASKEAKTHQIQVFEVDPSWVLEGNPNFRATEFFKSSDGKTSSGIFECDAGKFEWHYQLDEAVYVLEGSVNIDYQGKQFTLKAGESAFFRAGTTAVWQVPQHIKKTWTLYDAGKPARGLARLFE
jgi:uncharacterized cupin superfamily protein